MQKTLPIFFLHFFLFMFVCYFYILKYICSPLSFFVISHCLMLWLETDLVSYYPFGNYEKLHRVLITLMLLPCDNESPLLTVWLDQGLHCSESSNYPKKLTWGSCITYTSYSDNVTLILFPRESRVLFRQRSQQRLLSLVFMVTDLRDGSFMSLASCISHDAIVTKATGNKSQWEESEGGGWVGGMKNKEEEKDKW